MPRVIRIGSIIFGLLLVVWFGISLPDPLFRDPHSTVLTDRNGEMLGAKIASDGQWRFPEVDSLPFRYRNAVIYFEDEYFYLHPGINPVSMTKALIQNLSSDGRRGGSTITAQTIRLSRKGKSRSYVEKLIESILAIRLELRYSKEEILQLYSSYAPFGGNVVGLEAASWRYFGRSPEQLSWAESATLAVLPNAPSLIYPGKNQGKLLLKRNRLLDKLMINGKIDSLTCELAKSEPLPGRPKALPGTASHLLERMHQNLNDGMTVKSTLDVAIQTKANALVQGHSEALVHNQIHNAAMVIVDIKTMELLAYVGNSKGVGDGHSVDLVQAERSSGSILKPFLYAMAQDDGIYSPNALLPDIPTQIAGYKPLNFDKSYDGAVPANQALARSLNIPAVRMLQEYGLRKFTENIKSIGFPTIRKSADHYGLSLILGGAEVRLWDLANVYGNLARKIQYPDEEPVHMTKVVTGERRSYKPSATISDGAAWLTLEALSEMDRPLEGTHWGSYESSEKIAWKTGTSYGHRDAWAVGITPRYLVAVWVGNADGEGRPGLTGASTAAPLMFNTFKFLPNSGWFNRPEYDLIRYKSCSKSGYKASILCEDTRDSFGAVGIERSQVCMFHEMVHLNKSEEFRVASDCYPASEMVSKKWFVLPPVMEWYYKKRNSSYQSIPGMLAGCEGTIPFIDLIYPQNNQKIYVPRGFTDKENIVVKATHRDDKGRIYWHLDDTYLGETRSIHEMEIRPEPGDHRLTLVNEAGQVLVRAFEIVQ